MKRMIQKALPVALVVLCLLSLVACGKPAENASLWETAVYTEDTTLGEGNKTVVVEVTAQDKTVTFTVKTDAGTVGEALLANGLLDGENGDYGLYVKAVNGITADYDVDQSYWAFYIDGEYAMSGVDMTEITEGVTYQLVYTK